MTPASAPAPLSESLSPLVPALVAASAFAVADVTTKVTLNEGADALTMALFRGMVGVPLLAAWLFAGTRPLPLSAAHRNVALLVGVLFAGNVFFLFKAIEAMEVPVAILTYFTYPLLTGLAAAATGVERLGVAGVAAALAAFAGLALMIGAHPGGVALAGIAFGLLAALEPRRDPPDHARQAAGRRRAADLGLVDDRGQYGVRGVGAGALELAAAGVGAWLVGADRRQHRDGDRGAGGVYLDGARRPLPDGAVHESRAFAGDYRLRHLPR